MSKYTALKTDTIKQKWSTTVKVDNVRTFPKTSKKKK